MNNLDPPTTSRTRTVTWEDPTTAVRTSQTMSGLEYFRAMQTGEIPFAPIWVLMGIRIVEVSEGLIVFAAEPAEYHYNSIGNVHGGLAATLLDSTLGGAIHSMLPAGTSYITLELKVNYLRPMKRETGVVSCEGKVIHIGDRVATAEGRLTDAAGKLYAHGTTTCLLMRF